jgi:hypothetical protein
MRLRLYLNLIAILLGLVACSEDKKIVQPEGTPPEVLSIDSIRLGTAGVTAINLDDFVTTGGKAQVALNLRCRVLKRDSDPKTVSAFLYAPGSGEAVAVAVLSVQSQKLDTLTFTGKFDLTLDRSAVGNYTISAVAQDQYGQAGTTIRTKIRFYKNNLPPQLLWVKFSKDTLNVTVPPFADTLIVTAKPDDPDGPGDIASVEAVFNNFVFPMYDDGNRAQHGDAFLGDGIYSRGFSVNAGNTAGPRTFRFRAIDKSGDTSNVIEKTFYIKNN